VSDLSNEASATPSDTIGIGIPKNVKATKGNAQVSLSWGAVMGAATYNIYWATNPGVTTGSDSITGITKAAHVHTSLTNYTTYYYRITALDASGDASGLSDEVSATPDTSGSDLAPKNVVATPGTGQIVITWDPVNGGLSYDIYRDTSPGITENSPKVVDKLPVGSSSYTDSNVTAGTTYYYKVGVWVDAGGKYELHLSKEVSAMPSK
jgi:fibronectin type 3 domain-containing protein